MRSTSVESGQLLVNQMLVADVGIVGNFEPVAAGRSEVFAAAQACQMLGLQCSQIILNTLEM